MERTLKACSQGSEGRQGGEVPHLSVVKKYFSSHATPGTQGEVQNAIPQSLSVHINEEVTFVFFVCSGEAAFYFNVAVADKNSV